MRTPLAAVRSRFSWSTRDYALFLVGQTISFFGDQLYLFALLWWILSHTHSALAMAGALVIAAVSATVWAPAAGTLADRYDRRKSLVAMNGLFTVTATLAGVVMVTGHMTLAVLYLFTFLMATLEQFSMPIVSAAIPNLVRRESLVAANGLLETGKAVGGIAAPALGGMLLIWLPIGALLIVNASTFAVNAALLAGVSQSLKSSRGPKAGSIREDFAAGVAFLRRRRDLVLLIVILSLANMAVAPVGVLVPAAVKKDFGLGASQVGIAMSVFALGVLFSSQLLAWIRRVGSEALVLLVGLLALGAGQLLFGLTSRFALALGGSFIAGAAIIVVTVMGQTLFQRIVPDEVLGRVLSIRRALMTVLRPIGLLGGAAIADGSRPQIAIVAASSVIVAVALAGLASGALRHMGQRDAQLGAAPDPSQA